MKLSLLASLLFSSLISFAQTSELVVYTSRKEHLIKDIFAEYERKTGVKVKYRTGKAGALVQTLIGEGKNSSADLFMTVDAGNLWFAANKGLFASIDSSVLNKNIPNHLRDEKNRWFGLSVRARTLVYNTNKVKEGALNSYESLADKKWNQRLCLRTSKKVYNQSLVAMMIHENGYDKTKSIVSDWVKNAVDIFPNDTAVLKAVNSGQCDVGIVNTYYYGRLLKKDPKLPLKLFWPNQKDSYGTHVNISGAGILKNSKNKEEAQKFLEWLSSNEAQKKFAQVNMEYAINNSVPQAEEVIAWGEFKANTSFNLSKAGELQSQAIKLMHEAKYK